MARAGVGKGANLDVEHAGRVAPHSLARGDVRGEGDEGAQDLHGHLAVALVLGQQAQQDLGHACQGKLLLVHVADHCAGGGVEHGLGQHVDGLRELRHAVALLGVRSEPGDEHVAHTRVAHL